MDLDSKEPVIVEKEFFDTNMSIYLICLMILVLVHNMLYDGVFNLKINTTIPGKIDKQEDEKMKKYHGKIK